MEYIFTYTINNYLWVLNILIMTDKVIYNKIISYELNDEKSSFNFTDRLMRENGWSKKFAEEAIIEYKRFMYLIATSKGEIMTPSDEIDQVWHLHMLYTHQYRDFCKSTIGKFINHGPTRGGTNERTKYDVAYTRTKERYIQEFNIKPNLDFWASNEIRFSNVNWQRVNTNKNWVIRKPSISSLFKSKAVIGILAIMLLTFAYSCSPEIQTETQYMLPKYHHFVFGIVGLFVGLFVLYWVLYLVISFFAWIERGIRGNTKKTKLNSSLSVDEGVFDVMLDGLSSIGDSVSDIGCSGSGCSSGCSGCGGCG